MAIALSVFLLLLSGASDAVGSRACAHHAHAGHVEVEEGEAHDAHAGHVAGHGGDEEPKPDCDCGFLCFAVNGPPPLRTAPENVLRAPAAPSASDALLIPDADPCIHPALLPHVLPFSQGPPSRS